MDFVFEATYRKWLRLQRWLITEVHEVSDFLESLPGLSVMVLHTPSSDSTSCQELNFKAFTVTLNATTP